MYNKRVWLNKDDCSSTSNMVAFDGDINYSGEIIRTSFLKICDCRNSIKLHQAEYDTVDDFIEKMKLLRDEVDLFVKHLECNK